MIFEVIIFFLVIGYAALIGLYYQKWRKLPIYKSKVEENQLRISIIVPARNEANNIANAVNSISNQNYNQELIEIIVVDDHSSDETTNIVNALPYKNLRLIEMAKIELEHNEVAYKKRGIEEGVRQSNGVIIVTTDADCTHHKDWLGSIAAIFQEDKVNMVSAPVLFEYNNSLFERFQALDFLGMIGITAASIKMGMFNLANGANLAFRKSIFESVDGYKGIDQKASGDDMLLIYKFAQIDPQKVKFLKSPSAVVYTKAAKTMGEFIQQRLRWTSKSFDYQDHRITYILAFVYLVNLGLLSTLVMSFIFSFKQFFPLFIGQFVIMSIVDFLFLRRLAIFFKRKNLLNVFLPSQLFHVVYILVIGALGNIVKYQWKGRNLK